MSILVCGGAGYIGSHTVKLLTGNFDVIVLDNLVNGHREFVDEHAKFYHGDIRDKAILNHIFTTHNVEAVIHFAAYSVVSESISNPAMYFDNNVCGSFVLLETMKEHGISNIIFSSTAAVYGIPTQIPITEQCITNPINPYGETKLTIEKMLHWFSNAYGLNYVVLRYFNAAGADESSTIGECHNPETHLIPIVLDAIANQKTLKVFGDDYETDDGTCIRDYVHVNDLGNAHVLCLQALLSHKITSCVYNLGYGNGVSVFDIIKASEKVTGVRVKFEVHDKRQGDPPILIASPEKIIRELNWRPRFDNLCDIIKTAWLWHNRKC